MHGTGVGERHMATKQIGNPMAALTPTFSIQYLDSWTDSWTNTYE